MGAGWCLLGVGLSCGWVGLRLWLRWVWVWFGFCWGWVGSVLDGLVSLWHDFGFLLGLYWGHCWYMKVTSNHFGNTLGSLLAYAGELGAKSNISSNSMPTTSFDAE